MVVWFDEIFHAFYNFATNAHSDGTIVAHRNNYLQAADGSGRIRLASMIHHFISCSSGLYVESVSQLQGEFFLIK